MFTITHDSHTHDPYDYSMFTITHDFGDGTFVAHGAHDNSVHIATPHATLAVFYPDRQGHMYNRYTLNAAHLAAIGHEVLGGGILHMGASGLTIARALATLGIEQQTAVEIDMDKTQWLCDQYPPVLPINLVEGDAQDHTHLAASHPTSIVDLSVGPIDPYVAQPHIDVIAGIRQHADGDHLIISNVHMNPDSPECLVAIAQAHGGHTRLWADAAARAGGTGNVLLTHTNSEQLNAILGDINWDGWQLMSGED